MNKVSISFALIRFIFVSYLALALLTTYVVISQAVKYVDEQQRAFTHLEMQTINKNYRQFLDNHLQILREQSQHPLIVQSLMQAGTDKPIISAYFQHLRFLGQKLDVTLLDFDAKLVYSTQGDPSYHYINKPWLKPLLTNKNNHFITVEEINGQHYWILASVVKYNKHIEGILAVAIKLNTINQSVNPLNGLAVTIKHRQQPIATFGTATNGISHELSWPMEHITLVFDFDDTAINQTINQLILQLTAFIVIAILIITSLAYFLGYRYVVLPILNLAKATNSLEDGHQHVSLESDIRIKELSNLFDSFNRMSAKISQRESDLRSSQNALIKSHEELQYSEGQRLQSEKMASLGVLVAGVAHEINNPIGFINSNVDTLKNYWHDIQDLLNELERETTGTEQQQLLSDLYKKYDVKFLLEDINPLVDSTTSGILRVTEIIQSLKTFARSDTPNKIMADVNEGLNATLVMAKNELKYHCKINLSLAPLPPTLMYPSKLNQVFMNLLLNAGQAIEEQGEITIQSLVENNHIVVKISDTGIGIAPDKISQIFNPFYTSKPIGQGTGLGLSISHTIIEQHNGSIKVQSQVGQGTCFTITLPIIDDKQ